MSSKLLALCGIVTALVLPGCGGGSSSKSGSSSTVTSTPAAAAAALPANAPPALRLVAGRALVAGDLAGFAPQGQRTLGLSARSWVAGLGVPPSERARMIAHLEHLGFLAGVRERLTPTGGGPAEAISIVQRFPSPQAARQEVASEVSAATAHGAQTFTVAAIPAAQGFGGRFGDTTGYNVAFANGDYYYLVGAGFPKGAAHAPTQADVVRAAERLYARVHE